MGISFMPMCLLFLEEQLWRHSLLPIMWRIPTQKHFQISKTPLAAGEGTLHNSARYRASSLHEQSRKLTVGQGLPSCNADTWADVLILCRASSSLKEQRLSSIEYNIEVLKSGFQEGPSMLTAYCSEIHNTEDDGRLEEFLLETAEMMRQITLDCSSLQPASSQLYISKQAFGPTEKNVQSCINRVIPASEPQVIRPIALPVSRLCLPDLQTDCLFVWRLLLVWASLPAPGLLSCQSIVCAYQILHFLETALPVCAYVFKVDELLTPDEPLVCQNGHCYPWFMSTETAISVNDLRGCWVRRLLSLSDTHEGFYLCLSH